MKHFYYMVPPCPECGSRRTGRFIRQPFRQLDQEYVMQESLKNGEIVLLKIEVPEKNAFCTDCGYTWKADISLLRISSDEMEAERMRRGTDKLLTNYMKEHGGLEKKRSILGGLFSGLTRF